MVHTYHIRPERDGWRVQGGHFPVNLHYRWEDSAILHPIQYGQGRRRVIYYDRTGRPWFVEYIEGTYRPSSFYTREPASVTPPEP